MAENTIYVKDCVDPNVINPFLDNVNDDMNLSVIIPTDSGIFVNKPITPIEFYELYCKYYRPYREIALPTVASFQYEWAEIYKTNMYRFAEILKIESVRIVNNLSKDYNNVEKQPTYTREYVSQGNDNNVYSDTPNTAIPTRTESGFATSLDNTDYNKNTTENFVENPLKVAKDFLEKMPSFIRQFVELFDDLLYDCFVVKQNITNRKEWII